MVGLQKKISYFLSHPIVKYYSQHPLILLKNRLIILSLWFKKILYKDINFDDKACSSTPIDVVLVATDKDYEVLPYVIDSVRLNIKHPITKIVIISPKSKSIEDLCKIKKCVFVDENTVLPLTKKDINYTVNGIDRSGWLFQQLLKWSGDKYANNDYFLIADADTVFCRPQIFIYENKVILSVCHQFCHTPYFDIYKKLLGVEIKPLINLTSHHLLFNKAILTELKHNIEKRSGTNWYTTIINNIDPNEGSFVSDYETYGQFFYSNYFDDCILEHWFNLSLSRSKYYDRIIKILRENNKRYKTISFHSYKK